LNNKYRKVHKGNTKFAAFPLRHFAVLGVLCVTKKTDKSDAVEVCDTTMMNIAEKAGNKN
jgi:hypothetical protein